MKNVYTLADYLPLQRKKTPHEAGFRERMRNATA